MKINRDMKYAVLKCVNGLYSVHAEGFTDLKAAKISYHSVCQTLWNADDVITGSVMIVDENFDCVERYKEFITHPEVVDEEE